MKKKCTMVSTVVLCVKLTPTIPAGSSRRSRPKRTPGAIGGDCKQNDYAMIACDKKPSM